VIELPGFLVAWLERQIGAAVGDVCPIPGAGTPPQLVPAMAVV